MAQLIIPNWRVRYHYDKVYGKAYMINQDIGIDRRSVKAVEGGIYSAELGNIVDTDKDLREYSCFCGKLNSRLYEGDTCEDCETICKESFGIDLNKYGWISLGEYYIIQPNAYEIVRSVVGNKNLEKILKYQINIDIEGGNVDVSKSDPKSIPYQNIGLREFKKLFVEIMNYYAMIKPLKAEKAKFLIANKNRVFTNVIPIFSNLLRPAYASSKKRMFSYDKLNSFITGILSNAKLLKSGTSKRVKDGGDKILLWTIQEALQGYYNMTISSKLSGKHKVIRCTILSARTSFSSRAVITSLTDAKYIGMDHVVLNYKQFIEIYTFLILNCMMRGYVNAKFKRMTLFELLAYLKKAKYADTIDEDIYAICEFLIKNHKQGLWVILNRNPTMDLGSQQTLKVVHVIKDAKSCIMNTPLTSLNSMGGDYDGDILNVYALLELQVATEYIKGFSPRNLLVDRTGDSIIDKTFLPIKDHYTCANSFITPLRQ
ncbi:MAG: hypothetical protein ACRC5M_04310 [Anaeroplasmataceae bacterium]